MPRAPLLLSALVLAAPATADAEPRRTLPDLGVRGLRTTSAQVLAGSELRVRLSVVNRGRAKAKASQTGVWLSRDRRRDARDLALATKRTRALKRGKKAKLSLRVRVPRSAAAGDGFLVTCADARRKVKERRETDNCAAAPLRVVGGPAPIASPLTPVSPGAGAAAPTPTPTPTPTPSPTPTPTPTPGPLVRIARLSPSDGEGGVSVSRETIVEFSAPLKASSVSAADFGMTSLGAPVDTKLVLAADRRRVTLFAKDRLPASARVRVQVDGDGLRDGEDRAVDANGDGKPGGTSRYAFDTGSVTPVAGTSVCGTALAAEQADGADVPLAGVSISVDGAEAAINAVTDGDGAFCLDPAPAGDFFVHIDGRTATTPKPAGAYYPFVGKRWSSTPGDQASVGKIYLPLVPADALTPVSPTEAVPVGLPPSTLAEHPELAGVGITVPADALYSEDGSRGGKVGLALVPPHRLPGPLPPGQAPLVVITVQSDLGTNFDRPVPACFPNLPPPGGAAPPPGSKSSLVSFNHDLGDWEVAGSMTVSGDGELVCTDPGVGIRQPGWHYTQAATTAEGGGGVNPDVMSDCQKKAIEKWEEASKEIQAGLGFFTRRQPLYNVFEGAEIPGLEEAEATDHFKELLGLGARIATGSPAERQAAEREFMAKAPLMLIKMLGPSFVIPVGAGGGPLISGYLGALQALYDYISASLNCTSHPTGKPPPVAAKPAVIEQQQALGNKVAAVADAMTGAPAFHEGTPEDAANLGPFFEATAAAVAPQSDGGAEITTTERADIQSRPRPTGVSDDDVDAFLDRANRMTLDHQVLLDDDTAGAIEDASKTALTAVDAARKDGWRSTLHGLHLLMGDLAAATDVALEPTPVVARRLHYRIVGIGSRFELRDRTDAQGVISNVILPPDTLHAVEYLDPVTGKVGQTVFRTGPEGSRTQIPKALLVDPAPVDTDGDELPDFAEHIVGTDTGDVDSDDDGVRDGAEVSQDTDPLDGRPVRTGVIGATDTPGTAVGVDATGDLATVADSEGGVTLLDVSNRAAPVRVGRVATAGLAEAVALSGDTLTIADGPAGVAVADVSNPSAPVLLTQHPLGRDAHRIVAGADVAYVALDGREVVVVDVRSGAELDRIVVDQPVHDLALAGDRLYVLSYSRLYAFDDFGHGLGLLGSVEVPGSSSSDPLRSLFVGGDLAYVGLPTGFVGYRTVDVSDPAAMRIVGSPTVFSTAIHDIAANGSGLAVAATRVSNLTSRPVTVYDARDPAVTNQILASFPLEGDATAVSVFGGLTYAAAGAGGLQVLNHRAYDTAGVPPAVTLTAPATAEEGQPVTLTASVTDDVQAREVQFLVAGRVAAVDGSFPFEHRFRLPVGDSQGPLAVRARAVDTGGNAALSAEKAIAIVPDATAPSVRRISPTRSYVPGSRVTASAVFSEPLDPATVTRSRIRVFAPGGAEITGGTLVYRENSSAVALTLPDPLTDVGAYRVVVGPGFADLAGNAMTGTAEGSFHISLADLGPGDHVDLAGTIESSGGEDAHAIEVDAGQRLFFDVTSIRGGCGFANLSWRLTDPDGDAVFDDSMDQCANHGPLTLPDAGTYTLTIYGTGAEVGDYALTVWDVPAPDVTAVAIGDTLSGEIESPGREDRWRFAGTAGQRVFLDTQQVAGGCPFTELRVELLRPNGTTASELDPSRCGDRGPVTLDASGTWTVRVAAPDERASTGTYTIELWNVPAPDVTTVAIGDTLSGEIESPGREDRWTFSGTDGQRIFLDTREVRGGCPFTELGLELLRPNGTTAAELDLSQCGDRGPISLDAGGTWTLRVATRTPDRDETGSYIVGLLPVAPPDVTAVAIGDTLSGEIESPGREDRWTFSGTDGQRVFLDTQSVSGGCPFTELGLELLRPNGTTAAERDLSQCGDRGPVALDATGTWTVRVATQHADRDETGTYTIKLWNVPGADTAAMGFGDVRDGALETPGTEDRWTFTASAGQHVTFDVQAIDGSCPFTTLRMTLEDPDGAPVFTDHDMSLCADRADLALAKTGTYRLRVGVPADDDTVATYRFALELVSATARRRTDALAGPIRATEREIARRSLTPPRAAIALAEVSVAMERAMRSPRPAHAGAAGRAALKRALAAKLQGGAQRTLPVGEGVWQPTPPMFAWPSEPLAGTWPTFNIASGGALEPPAPPAPGSAELDREMRQIYALTTPLSAERRRIAERWEARRGTQTPPGLWNDIALRILRHERTPPARAARILAALNTAQADSMIAVWHAKYRWWTERPVTYIRREIDPDWMPPLRTPNFPGYVSGHSTTSAAAAEVLGAAFPTRAARLRRMAAQAGMSRLYGGIHTRSDHEQGARLGRAVARAAIRRWLR